jgi:hypothetical protein
MAAAVIAIMPASAPTAAMLAIPFMPATGPIATMMIAHMVAMSPVVEDVIAVARIPEAVIPATTKAYIVETIAAVAGVIAVKWRKRIAVIAIIGIAIIIIANAQIIDAAR